MSARRAVFLLAVVALLALLTLLSVGVRPVEPVAGSARSAADDGRLALFQLFERLGFEPGIWDRPVGELPAGRTGGTLWLPAVPRDFDPEVPPDDPLERVRASGPFAWSHYPAFVRDGGVLVLPASEQAARFCERVLGLAQAAELDFEGCGAAPLQLALGAEQEGPWRDVTTRAGKPVARRAALGRGAVLLVADGDWLDNSGLAVGDRALCAVRLVEGFGGDGPLRFDEQALAGWRAGGSAAALALGTGGLFTWHLAALLALVVWAAAWPREFPRDPRRDEALAPLLRARATAGLLVSAGRIDTLAAMLRGGLLARLLGPASGDGRADERELAALARRHGGADQVGRWVEVLATRPVRDLEELVELDRELRELEHGSTPRSSGREQE